MSYDPRRSRPTPKVVPDEESAPIDGLLGPSPAVEPDAGPGLVVVEESDDVVADLPEPDASLPAPVRKPSRAPSPWVQLAPLLVAALLVLLWLLRRARRDTD